MINTHSVTGMRGGLVVVVSIYTPSITCWGPVQRAGSVSQNLLNMLPVSFDRQVFGPIGEQGVQVVVPQIFSSMYTFFISDRVFSSTKHSIFRCLIGN